MEQLVSLSPSLAHQIVERLALVANECGGGIATYAGLVATWTKARPSVFLPFAYDSVVGRPALPARKGGSSISVGSGDGTATSSILHEMIAVCVTTEVPNAVALHAALLHAMITLKQGSSGADTKIAPSWDVNSCVSLARRTAAIPGCCTATAASTAPLSSMDRLAQALGVALVHGTIQNTPAAAAIADALEFETPSDLLRTVRARFAALV